MIQANQLSPEALHDSDTPVVASISTTLVFLVLAALGSMLLVAASPSGIAGALTVAAVLTSIFAALKTAELDLEF